MCGGRSAPPAIYTHIVWIVMENHSYGSVIGSPSAPYQTQLAKQCESVPRWATVGAPSLPNYLGLTGGDTFGVHDDGDPATHPIVADNLFRQVRDAGKTERSFEEDMPHACALSSAGRYAVKHNPAAYYAEPTDRAACVTDDVPLGATTGGPLADAIASDTLPSFTLITPNLCDDTHDCATRIGDRWLSEWVPKLTSMPSYQSGTTLVAIVYDEYTPIPNVILSASVVPGARVTSSVNHYSLLRLTEELLGITNFLGGATTATDLRVALHV
jgi:hypothetical protein